MNSRWLLPAAFLLTGIGTVAPVSAQMMGPRPYVVYQPQPAPNYAPPQYAIPNTHTYRAARIRPRTTALRPYTRSPYTDDWSTARHLPFPKPWMLPTR